MKIHIVIGVLLACTVAGLPAKDEVLPGDIFTPTGHELFKDEVPYVFDDNGNLVKLTLGDAVDVNLNEDEIAKSVTYFLHKKDNRNPKQLYVDDEDALKNSNFDPTKPTRFITHGWHNSRNSPACTEVRDAFLQHGDYNIIVIDWSPISGRIYTEARLQVVKIARFVSTMINFLVKHGMDPSQTIMIGHSLGAHIVGIAARNANSQIGYVVGLDPAWPEFVFAGPGSRISIGDAKYVEIIHTNGGLLGFLQPIGDVDFYPNGGSKQLGCIVDIGGSCSHARSYLYYAESIISQVGFPGKNCSSFLRFRMGLCNNSHTSLMGGHKPLFSAHGTYYLVTNPKSPFAIRY